MGSRSLLTLLIAALTVTTFAETAHVVTTLEKIRAAGALSCGVNTEEPEYSTEDAHGNHVAFDADLCKAVAVATLGTNAKFTVVPFRDEQDALKALEAGRIDLLATASANYVNTVNPKYGFGPIVFYDYQGFLVNTTMNVQSAKDLAGKKVCFLGGTEIESQIQGYMKREKINWLPFPFQEEGEMEAAFITRNCAAITADVSQLAYERIAFKGFSTYFQILPDVVAKDPLAPAYRKDDPQWAAIVDWTAEALIQAEESGVTQASVAAMKKSDDPDVQRLLGSLSGYGQYLNLDNEWAARAIGAVGNYGELFDRDLGAGSQMKLARGPNNLWSHGGLMYALPIR